MDQKKQTVVTRGVSAALAALMVLGTAGTVLPAHAAQSSPTALTVTANGTLDAYDRGSMSGTSVIAAASDPATVAEGVRIHVITCADTAGKTYTTGSAYTGSGEAAITESDPFDSYLCVDGSGAVAGILFVQQGAEASGAEALVGDGITIQGFDGGATEPEQPSYPDTMELSVKVKAGADNTSLRDAIRNRFAAENPGLPIADIGSADFAKGGEMEVQFTYKDGTLGTLNISIAVVEPDSWNFKNGISDIASTHSYNASAVKLLEYVNSDRVVVPSGGSEYQNALGTVTAFQTIPAFTWKQCDMAYTEAGGVTYTFTQDYQGTTLTRKLTVSAGSHTIGSIHIDYEDNTVDAQSGMKWSLDKKTWKNCSDNMKIPSSWYDRTVYFQYPEDKFGDESAIRSLYVPPKADKPEEKLELSATTYSITIENCWEFGDVEFSIDGVDWTTTRRETLTYDDLESNTSYKVYVRTCADEGNCLASDPVTKTVRTEAPIITGIDVKTSTNKDTGIITGTATLAPEGGKRLTGSLESNHFTKMNNTLKTFLSKYDSVEAHLVVNHYPEDNLEGYSAQFTMNLSNTSSLIRNADMDLEYRTEFLSILMNNEDLRDIGTNRSLSINTQKLTSAPSGSKMSWLKEQYNDDNPVYRVSVKSSNKYADEFTISIPYELGRNEGINGLNVYMVETNGDRSAVDFTYDTDRQAVLIPGHSEDAYYVVVNEGHSDVRVLPFRDVPANFWAYNQILYVYNRGIMVGTSDVTFTPDSQVTRAQVITMIARMGGADTSEAPDTTHFKDVQATDWYAASAEWAYAKGIYKTSNFNGNEPIERQEIAQMLYQYLTKVEGYSSSIDKGVQNFADYKSISSNCRNAVQFMKQYGVMVGYGNNVFGPTDKVTRAQMAAVTNRMYTMLEI